MYVTNQERSCYFNINIELLSYCQKYFIDLCSDRGPGILDILIRLSYNEYYSIGKEEEYILKLLNILLYNKYLTKEETTMLVNDLYAILPTTIRYLIDVLYSVGFYRSNILRFYIVNVYKNDCVVINYSYE